MNPWYLLTLDTVYIPKRLTMSIESKIALMKLFVSAAVSIVTVIMSLKVESWLPTPTYLLWRLTRRSESVIAEMESSRNDLNRFSFGLVENAINRKIAHKSFRRMLGPNGDSRVFSGWDVTTPGCLFASLLIAGPSAYAFWRFYFLLLFPENPKDHLPDDMILFFIFGLTGVCVSLLLATPLSRYFIGNVGIREFVDPFFNRTYAVKGIMGTLFFCKGLLERIYATKTARRCRNIALDCFLSVFFIPILLLIRQWWGQECYWAVVAEHLFTALLTLIVVTMVGVEIWFHVVLYREVKKARRECSWIKA